MTDPGENRHQRLTKELGEIQVIQPSQVRHGATAPNNDEGVEWPLFVGGQGFENGGLDRR
jgi:hypothetical protein